MISRIFRVCLSKCTQRFWIKNWFWMVHRYIAFVSSFIKTLRAIDIHLSKLVHSNVYLNCDDLLAWSLLLLNSVSGFSAAYVVVCDLDFLMEVKDSIHLGTVLFFFKWQGAGVIWRLIHKSCQCDRSIYVIFCISYFEDFLYSIQSIFKPSHEVYRLVQILILVMNHALHFSLSGKLKFPIKDSIKTIFFFAVKLSNN